MANKIYNKVIWGDETLIDLTGDTVEAQYIIKKKTAHDKSGKVITGTCPYDADTSDGTATADEILNGEVAYVNGSRVTGSMPKRNGVTGYITKVDEPYSIQVGHHDGSGKVYIHPDEAAKIQPANIRDGYTILGVRGTMTGTESVETEPGSATPGVKEVTYSPSAGKYFSQFTVGAIPYVETANTYGTTVKIG